MEFSILRVNPLVSMTILAAMLSSALSATAKGGPPQGNPAAAAAAAQQEQAAAMQRAQQAQQAQQRNQQEAMQRMQVQQQQARVQQEQAMRAQEEQARNMQMKAVQQQQEQARNMQQQQQKMQQEQSRNVQEQQQKMQQEQARNMQEQQQKMQQEQARNMQEQQQKMQQEQARNMQEQQQKMQQEQARNMQEQQQKMQQEQAHNMQQQQNSKGKEWQDAGRKAQEATGRGMFPGRTEMPAGGAQAGMNRAFKAKPLGISTVPIEKAVPQPVIAPNSHPGEQEHSQAVTQNLQRHLLAVPGAQAPQNRMPLIGSARTNYFNNYQTVVNNRRIFINPQNTNVSYFQPNQYPTWYQPHPDWVLANGFTLGNDIHCGLDWLQWGWHPYYGPPPEGFVCSNDYFPTPWIYIPAYGVWRQPGEFGYSPSGPPYDYTGPISVEVLEPRHVHTRDPYSGWVNDSIINVVYFYDAFYYPDMDRWGYMNRHDYFIWLNIDPDDGSGYPQN